MSYKIAICDDEMNMRDYIKELLMIWSHKNEVDVAVDQYESSENFLFHYAENKNYNILLLDIEMKEINGVSLAKKIRENNKSVEIIFITGYSEYISEGYDVDALNYLIKPVDKNKLFSVLDKAMEKLKESEKSVIIEYNGEMIILYLNEIRYVDVYHNYITVHAGEDYEIKRTLKDFEGELSEDFFRLGRSCIVNLKYLRKVSKKDVYLKDGTVIPLPRGAYESLNRAIIERY